MEVSEKGQKETSADLAHFTFSTGGIAQVPSIAAFRGEYSRA